MSHQDVDHQSKLISGRSNTHSIAIIAALDDKDREKLWYNHFNNLLNPVADPLTTPSLTGIHSDFRNCKFTSSPFTLSELQASAFERSNDKAPGLDEMVAEIVKLPELHSYFLYYINLIYESNILPSD